LQHEQVGRPEDLRLWRGEWAVGCELLVGAAFGIEGGVDYVGDVAVGIGAEECGEIAFVGYAQAWHFGFA
jgi:hypothetical protein